MAGRWGGGGAAGPTAVSRQGQGAAAERADPPGLRPPVLLPQENTQIRDLRQENRGEPAAGDGVWRGPAVGVGGGDPGGRVGWRAGGPRWVGGLGGAGAPGRRGLLESGASVALCQRRGKPGCGSGYRRRAGMLATGGQGGQRPWPESQGRAVVRSGGVARIKRAAGAEHLWASVMAVKNGLSFVAITYCTLQSYGCHWRSTKMR